MPYTSLTPAKYAASLREQPATTPDDSIPWADSVDDAIEWTVSLDGGTAHVDHYTDRVEITVRLGKSVHGLVLSPGEAFDLGNVLAQPRGCDGEATVADLFRVADHLGVEASELLAMRQGAA